MDWKDLIVGDSWGLLKAIADTILYSQLILSIAAVIIKGKNVIGLYINLLLEENESGGNKPGLDLEDYNGREQI